MTYQGGSDHETSHRSTSSWSRRSVAQRVRSVMPSGLRRRVARVLGRGSPINAPWAEDSGFRRRRYATEAHYLVHQRSKLDHRTDFVAGVDRELERVLARRIPDVLGKSVLCLAARLGGEVRAFRAAGAFALGIDLNPGPDNRWVLAGDFHRLDFADASVDMVYTNSLDHALDLHKVASEVSRVLKPGGSFILEAGLGQAEGGSFGDWEATAWRYVEDLVRVFAAAGLTAEAERLNFTEPWQGSQVQFRR